MPRFTADVGELEVIKGRHPVLEQLGITGSNDRFVPNDLYLNSTSHSILLITGPNMGGKSTYLRQTALTVLMAQMGGFVPARSARLPVVDRIFTRIGASDNLRARTFNLHGGDDGDRGDPQHRYATLADPAG